MTDEQIERIHARVAKVRATREGDEVRFERYVKLLYAAFLGRVRSSLPGDRKKR